MWICTSSHKIEDEFHEVFGKTVSSTNPEIVQLFTLIAVDEIVTKSMMCLFCDIARDNHWLSMDIACYILRE